MPSKNVTNVTKSPEQPAGRGVSGPPQFVKYRLTDDEMDQAKNAATEMADIGEIFAQLIGEGYKVSASYDNYGKGVQVFLTPSNKDNANFGWTLTARAPMLLLAVGVLCWKHYTLFMQNWPKEVSEQQGSGWG